MLQIVYRLKFENSDEKIFIVDINRNTKIKESVLDTWTKLEFKQCSICPLETNKTSQCPAAVDVYDLVNAFSNISSIERIQTLVETEQRNYFKECDAQTALRAIIGLIMATSQCPILKRMKGMAHYHLPFASMEETVMRSVSTYLLKQYFLYKEEKKCDWELSEFAAYYEQLQTVNQCFFERIKKASQSDANLNSIVSLSSMSTLMTINLDEYIDSMKKQFI